MTTLVCLGLGYSARHYIDAFGKRFDRIVGTSRTTAGLKDENSVRAVEMYVFDGGNAPQGLHAAIADSNALLISAAPIPAIGDPVLAALRDPIMRASCLTSIIVLSSIGVYGNSDGAWIDETAPTPASEGRRKMRAVAEKDWQQLGSRRELPISILRLGGIYGPGRNAFTRLRSGMAQRIVKPHHVSNRIHVFDIAQAIDAALDQHADGIFNVVDNTPAAPSEVIAYAASLIDVEPPPEISFDQAAPTMSQFALSFYDGCIRVRNDRLKNELGVRLRHSDYRQGLRALLADGE
jgi:nucleoside-diphosphate-sugar epimerase